MENVEWKEKRKEELSLHPPPRHATHHRRERPSGFALLALLTSEGRDRRTADEAAAEKKRSIVRT
jgi:hypothetical protein